jgi:hypothetical protein
MKEIDRDIKQRRLQPIHICHLDQPMLVSSNLVSMTPLRF